MLMQSLGQTVAVAFIVSACTAYSGWTLMPTAWRRVLATQLVRSRVLAQSAVLMRAAQPASAGTCGGCASCGSAKASTNKTPNATESVIHFSPRKTK